MNLWLDDKRPPPPGFSWARTAKDATSLLRTGEVDFASLDHDLGILEPTGYDVILWMAKTNTWPRYRPAVHSANRVGAARMISAIILYGPYK